MDYALNVIVGWEVNMERRPVSEYENQYSCDVCEFMLLDDAINTAPNVGQWGFRVRFRIVKDYLYVVDYRDLSIFDIPPVPLHIETIFNQGEVLFIGGRQGMYIYEIKSLWLPSLYRNLDTVLLVIPW